MTTPDAAHEPFITAKEMAARLRLTPMTIYRRLHAGEIPGALRVGKSFRIPESAYDAYVKASEISS